MHEPNPIFHGLLKNLDVSFNDEDVLLLHGTDKFFFELTKKAAGLDGFGRDDAKDYDFIMKRNPCHSPKPFIDLRKKRHSIKVLKQADL